MPDTNNFLNTVKDNLLGFAEENLKEYKDELLKDGNAFVKKTKNDLERWGQGLLTGALSKNDFEFLVKGKEDLAEMEALKQAGLGKIKISKLRDGVIGIVINSALKTFL
jgi:hypothetical protein